MGVTVPLGAVITAEDDEEGTGDGETGDHGTDSWRDWHENTGDGDDNDKREHGDPTKEESEQDAEDESTMMRNHANSYGFGRVRFSDRRTNQNAHQVPICFQLFL